MRYIWEFDDIYEKSTKSLFGFMGVSRVKNITDFVDNVDKFVEKLKI
jgi:hypothetical protein